MEGTALPSPQEEEPEVRVQPTDAWISGRREQVRRTGQGLTRPQGGQNFFWRLVLFTFNSLQMIGRYVKKFFYSCLFVLAPGNSTVYGVQGLRNVAHGPTRSTLTRNHLICQGGFARFKTQAILLQNCFIPRGLVNQRILVFNLSIMTKNRSKK